MPKSYSLAVIVTLACVLPAPLHAQVAPIITDRPDFTESPFAVPVGSIQIEMGVSRETANSVTSYSGLEALLRWSPVASFEIRLQPPGYLDAGLVDGYTDVGVGAKVELGTIAAWDVGAIASVALPTGSSDTSTGSAEPLLILAAGRGLGDDWSLGVQASTAWLDEADGFAVGSTLVAGRAVTENVGSFLEIAVDRAPGSSAATVLHGGFTFSLSPTLQLDLHGLAGLTDAAPTHAVGVGFSTRFD